MRYLIYVLILLNIYSCSLSKESSPSVEREPLSNSAPEPESLSDSEPEGKSLGYARLEEKNELFEWKKKDKAVPVMPSQAQAPAPAPIVEPIPSIVPPPEPAKPTEFDGLKGGLRVRKKALDKSVIHDLFGDVDESKEEEVEEEEAQEDVAQEVAQAENIQEYDRDDAKKIRKELKFDLSEFDLYDENTLKNTKDFKPSKQLDLILSQNKPTAFWPRKAYFQNRYLGGDPGYIQQKNTLSLDLRHYLDQDEAKLNIQPLDIPQNQALGLSVYLSRNDYTGPQPVLMQIALQGSDRFGWRRPPINWMIVISPSLLANYFYSDHSLSDLLGSLLKMLEPMDQVGFLIGDLEVAPMNLDELRAFIMNQDQRLKDQSFSIYPPSVWVEKLTLAGSMLEKTANHPHRVPGTQGLLLFLDSVADRDIEEIKGKVHELNLKGIVSSVFVENSKPSHHDFWQIAEQGHGNAYEFKDMAEIPAKIEEELKQNAKVIARLLRINIKTAKNVHVTRILGTQLLESEEVKRVKEKEKAMDQALSQVYGVKANRGDDDDGLQVVIPYFYGNDQHIISVLLWVEQAGEIAEVELKYKDLISLTNAQMSTTVALSHQIQNELSPLNQEVLHNAMQILDAELLEKIASSIENADHLSSQLLSTHLYEPQLQSKIKKLIDSYAPKDQQQLLLELMSRSKKGLAQSKSDIPMIP